MNGCDLFLKFNGWSCFAFPSSQRKFSPINRWLHTYKEGGREILWEKKKVFTHTIPRLTQHKNPKPNKSKN